MKINTASFACECNQGYYRELTCDSQGNCQSDGNDVCKACPERTFNPNTGGVGLSACVDCPGNFISGLGFCINCPAGNIYDFDNACCVACEKGEYQNANSNTCDPCPEGTYNGDVGQIQCKKCEDGTFTQVQGSTSCEGKCNRICSKCIGPTIKECLECRIDIPRIEEVQDMTCGCQKGYYYDSSVNINEENYCVPCAQFCSYCDNTGCLSCDNTEGVQLVDGKCECNAPGYSVFFNEKTGRDECLECNILCDTCFGPLSTQCISCNEKVGAIFIDQDHCGCSSHHYYDDSAKQCEECNVLCANCNGPGSDQCERCNEALSYDVQNIQGLCVPYCSLLGEYYTSGTTCIRNFKGCF